ncbi:hypothetical protein Alches_23200 [Alicyclobacillus hesperidum subsp. aegles]|uniref:ATP-binding protein n=1 Tax=Alicyclobacillus hesperidum TaxID=89784 RepID=UPI00222D6558|nr:ATP-binding protein [Alicyclobacillus hesperidum]GLG02279.1 hypothetical protein Alches_23200 [Alicyclobacillus hesperidum subsp. aegles]
MPIETVAVSPLQRDNILDYEEGHFLDLKSIDIGPGKLTETIAAFANADGGELFIGIDEQVVDSRKVRQWRGFSDFESANGHIQIFEQLFPLGEGYQYTFLECEGCDGYVLKIDIHKSPGVVRASNGHVYIRRGAQKLKLTTDDQLRRLDMDKGVVSFETEVVDIPQERISNSLVIINFMLAIIPTNEPETWLKKQLLIKNNKPTVAGILLFDDEPQAVLPKRCAIKIFRYKTAEPLREGLAFDPITIEGCLYEQIRQAVEKTVELVEGIRMLGAAGFSEVKYPLEALHEIITNAVLHRDYSIPADIQIRIFDNRIEVESPGKLPGHVTVKNILNEQFARNGSVVRIINKFPDAPNKDVGEGLNTAFDAMRQLKLKDPIIQETDSSVIVIIRHEPLASPEELVVEYLRQHAEINNSVARSICHIGSENVMKRVFERLMNRGIIERVPGKRGKATAYRLIKQDDDPQRPQSPASQTVDGH